MSKLILQPRRWYAWQDVGAGAMSVAPFTTSPVFVNEVTPLKTGKGDLEVDFVRAIGCPRATSDRCRIRIRYQTDDLIIGSIRVEGRQRLVALTPMSMDWLRQHCPLLIKRFASQAWGWSDDCDPQEYLNLFLGASPEAILAGARPPTSFVVSMPDASGSIPFERAYVGMDAWLFLRGRMPLDQDDKWLIFIEPEGRLRLCRSATGNTIWEVQFDVVDGGVACRSARVNLDAQQRSFGTPEEEARALEDCISWELLGESSKWPTILTDHQHADRAAAEWKGLGFACISTPTGDARACNETTCAPDIGGADNGRSPPEMIASLMEADDGVPDGPPLNAYPLHTEEGREAFLQRLMEFGEPGVLSAASHVWSSLARPAGARCTHMGALTGTGGKGKVALHKVLTAFVKEWLGEELPPLPPVENFDTLANWNRAAMTVFADEHEREIATVKKYAAILNGEEPYAGLELPTGTVLEGPWRIPQ